MKAEFSGSWPAFHPLFCEGFEPEMSDRAAALPAVC